MVQNTTQSIPYKGEGTINIHINNPSACVSPMPQMSMPVYYPMYYPVYYYPSYYMNNGLDKTITEQLRNIASMQALQNQKLYEIANRILPNGYGGYYNSSLQNSSPGMQNIGIIGQNGLPTNRQQLIFPYSNPSAVNGIQQQPYTNQTGIGSMQQQPYNNNFTTINGMQQLPYNNQSSSNGIQQQPYTNQTGIGNMPQQQYNNSSATIEGIQQQPYNNQAGIANMPQQQYNNSPATIGGVQQQPYNNQTGMQQQQYNNSPATIGGIQQQPYNNQAGIANMPQQQYSSSPATIGGVQQQPYNNQAGMQQQQYNNSPATIGGIQQQPYNNQSGMQQPANNNTTIIGLPYNTRQQQLNEQNPSAQSIGKQNTDENSKNTISQQSLYKTSNIPQENKQKEIVLLTDNYIKNLENFLRNPNLELRQNAMKEVLERFKEERSRFRDPALTALLNLGLQDMNGSVKALAMAILDAGYAAGDKTTEKILRTMQNSNNNYSQDALSAANTLLKMSQTKALVNDNSAVNINRKG